MGINLGHELNRIFEYCYFLFLHLLPDARPLGIWEYMVSMKSCLTGVKFGTHRAGSAGKFYSIFFLQSFILSLDFSTLQRRHQSRTHSPRHPNHCWNFPQSSSRRSCVWKMIFFLSWVSVIIFFLFRDEGAQSRVGYLDRVKFDIRPFTSRSLCWRPDESGDEFTSSSGHCFISLFRCVLASL